VKIESQIIIIIIIKDNNNNSSNNDDNFNSRIILENLCDIKINPRQFYSIVPLVVEHSWVDLLRVAKIHFALLF
jgi:hypothetical protein